MIYLLICLLPVSMAAGYFAGIKAVQVGLRWQMQTKAGVTPTMEAVVLPQKAVKSDMTSEIINEWQNGEQKKVKDGK